MKKPKGKKAKPDFEMSEEQIEFEYETRNTKEF